MTKLHRLLFAWWKAEMNYRLVLLTNNEDLDAYNQATMAAQEVQQTKEELFTYLTRLAGRNKFTKKGFDF